MDAKRNEAVETWNYARNVAPETGAIFPPFVLRFLGRFFN